MCLPVMCNDLECQSFDPRKSWPKEEPVSTASEDLYKSNSRQLGDILPWHDTGVKSKTFFPQGEKRMHYEQ